MSEENVELVRRMIRHFSETGGGIEPDFYDPEVVFTTRPDGLEHNTYQGIDGLRQGVESIKEAWADLIVEVGDMEATGEVVVVPLLWHLRSQGGVQMDVEETWAYWLRDGRIYRVEQHGTTQEALEAAGLRH
jgi:SnoaL-like protein